MQAKRYRSKPVEIEAMQYDGTPECIDEIVEWNTRVNALLTELRSEPGALTQAYRPIGVAGRRVVDELRIATLEGVMRVDVGDYVICGLRKEFYPCKPDVFEQKYEEV